MSVLFTKMVSTVNKYEEFVLYALLLTMDTCTVHRHIKSPKSERMHDICVISNQFDNSCYFLIGFVSHKGKFVINGQI